jgi:hypothetical protein
MSKRITGYSMKTPQSMTSGAGVVFENFDMATDTYDAAEAKKAGATTGGVKITVEYPDAWTREIDGLPSNTVGLYEPEFIKPTVTFSIVEVSNASRLKNALGGADIKEADKPTGYQVVTPRADLADTDYLQNLTIFTRTKKGEPLIIVLENPLSTEGFEFATESKAGGAIEVTYTGNFDPMDLDNQPVKFYVPTPAE